MGFALSTHGSIINNGGHCFTMHRLSSNEWGSIRGITNLYACLKWNIKFRIIYTINLNLFEK
jgi:hypothetical protein